MRGPYRDSGAMVKAEAPESLECWLRDGDKNRWIRSIYVKVSFTVIACLFLVQTTAGLAALPVLAIGALWAWSDFRKRKGEGVMLRVTAGTLHVDLGRGQEPFELPLEEVGDVRLDTKTTSKNVNMARADGVNTVFGMGSSHNIDLDQSRIELVTDQGEAVLLGTEYISGTLCTESLRSIRLFLRAHGWKPLDERPPPEEEDEEDGEG